MRDARSLRKKQDSTALPDLTAAMDGGSSGETNERITHSALLTVGN